MRKLVWLSALGIWISATNWAKSDDDAAEAALKSAVDSSNPISPKVAKVDPATPAVPAPEEDTFDLFAIDFDAAPESAPKEAKKTDTQKLSDLSPDLQKQFAEFASKTTEAWMKQAELDAKLAVKQFVDTNKLTKDEKEKVQELITPTLKELPTIYEKKLTDWLSPFLSSGQELIRDWNPEQISRSSKNTFTVTVLDTEAWKSGLKTVLQPERLAKIEAAQKAQRDKVFEEMKDVLAATEDQAKEYYAKIMESEMGQLTQNCVLDEARSKELKKAADDAAAESAAEWRSKANAQVEVMQPPQLASLKKRASQRAGPFSLGMSIAIDKPEEKPRWKDAVNKILTAEELKTIEERRKLTRKHRSVAICLNMLAEVDPLIGLSDSQRLTLLKAGSPQMMSLPDYYFEAGDPNRGYTSFNMGDLLTRLQGIDAKVLESTLDASQLKRWKALKPDMFANNYSSRRVELSEDEKKFIPSTEVEAEQFISDTLFKQSQVAKAKSRATMESRLEVLTRVTKPDEATAKTLATAAKGSVEALADATISQTTVYLRQQISNVPPAEVPKRLVSFYFPYYSRSGKERDPEIWKTTVDRVLNATQKEAWARVCEERDKWQQRAVSAMVLTEVEKQMNLKPTQWAQLKQKVDAIMKDYEPDIENYFSPGWHLQGYYVSIPVALIPEKEMLQIFSKDEYEMIKDRSLGNTQSYVESLKQQHDRRVGKKSKELDENN